MSDDRFPTLPGLMWNFSLSPLFNTLVQESTSGREVRARFQRYPRWEIVLMYEFLRNDPETRDETGATELEELVGFYNSHGGGFDSFLLNLTDLTGRDEDSVYAGQPIGTGDGSNKKFQLVRNIGGYMDIVQSPEGQLAQVYDNDTPLVQNTDYTIANGLVTFVTAPLTGHLITADFVALFRCRFNTSEAAGKRSQQSSDLAFSNFSNNLWECRQVSLITVKV